MRRDDDQALGVKGGVIPAAGGRYRRASWGGVVKPLRIIMVIPEPPLPFGGAAARIYYTTQKGLVARGHHLTTFVASANPQAKAEAQRLFPPDKYDLRFFTPDPPSALRRILGKWSTYKTPMAHQFSGAFQAALSKELHKDFDLLHLEDLWSGYLGVAHRHKAVLNSHCLQAIDLDGVRAATFEDRMFSERSKHMEQRLLQLYPEQLTLTPELSAAIHKINPSAHVGVIPLPIELELYPYVLDEVRTRAKRLALIGSFHWAPTRSAAHRLLTKLWPEIRAQVPEAELELTGWGARRILASYDRVGNVIINESVPDIKPYFERASVLLYAPHHASGMKVKVLESMAFGVPVVTTPDGVEGLPIDISSGEGASGVCAMVGATDEALIDAAVTLLRDPARQNRQRLAARKMLGEHCNPSRVVDQFEASYVRILASRRP